MRRVIYSLISAWCLLLLAVLPANAAGTATVTSADLGGGVTKYTIAWTSSAGGAVSGNTFNVARGQLLQVKFVPGTAGTQPSDLYDVTLVDTDSIDYLMGVGANLSNATASIKATLHSSSSVPVFIDGSQAIDLVVANAGNAKTGTVILLIGRE